MQVLKPSWVNHDGKPLFSIDIHPDGSRFATGGQGADSGKIVIWNMAPVQDEQVEKDDNIPKILCQMDNHLGCVNCVRWSHHGNFLASASDDKLVMIWECRGRGQSTIFGSDCVNHEQWRCKVTLRGHSGDVLDLAWSPHDAWLATCSVDNLVIIWNTNKYPEQIAVLKGHTGLVKGVAWDPVGKYLASQSDDKSVRIWRTYDWQQDAVITEPFGECGGTTHVLRLGWSPDGHYVVSAHAMNNSGPTAQIIERTGWKANMDFVGHRKAVTVVRFNPNIFTKNLKKDSETQYTSCAIGSRDRSLSVWVTALKRPLVVFHDMFTNSILDVAWSKSGYELLCCSWDGTVSYLRFSPETLGAALSAEEHKMWHEKTYGKSLLFSSNASKSVNQIIETAAMFKIQTETEALDAISISTPAKNPGNESSGAYKSPMSKSKQIETRTPDGRRRITPIFLALPEYSSQSPMPFNNANTPVFSSSKSQSNIVVEKQDIITKSPCSGSKGSISKTLESRLTTRLTDPPNTSGISSDQLKQSYQAKEISETPTCSHPKDKPAIRTNIATIQPISALVDKSTEQSNTKVTSKEKFEKQKTVEKDKEKSKQFTTKRKLATELKSSAKRKQKEHKIDYTPASAVVNTVQQIPVPNQMVYATSNISLPVASIGRTAVIQLSCDSVVEVENDLPSGGVVLHRMRCVSDTTIDWEVVLTSSVLAATANRCICCAACHDASLSFFTSTGRRLLPIVILDSQVSVLHSQGYHVMAVTIQGNLYVWNLQTCKSVIRKESIQPILSDTSKKIVKSMVTEHGVPVITLNSGKSYTFKDDLASWMLMSSSPDPLLLNTDQKMCTSKEAVPKGTLFSLQNQAGRTGTGPGGQASQISKASSSLQQPSTISYLEQQVTLCLTLKSGQEYRFWLMTYIRYLAHEGIETKLREACQELLGPIHKSKQSKWKPYILGVNKRQLLEEVLPVIGTHLRLQRLFTEFKEQLDAIKC